MVSHTLGLQRVSTKIHNKHWIVSKFSANCSLLQTQGIAFYDAILKAYSKLPITCEDCL
jgi:hypothetical protein